MKTTNSNPLILTSYLQDLASLTKERDELNELAIEITFARMNQEDIDRLGEITNKIDRLKLFLIKQITTL